MKIPDGDGDGGSFVRLPLVLSRSAPHHHVSVFQLLRSRSREPRAALTAGKQRPIRSAQSNLMSERKCPACVVINLNLDETHVLE